MVTVIFESHATTFDNEQKIASGHSDVELSELGIQQAKELGQRYQHEHFDVIFCSDLKRSYRTAEIAFGNTFPIVRDSRLRECNYGSYEHRPNLEIEKSRAKYITMPFPNGESYEQRIQLMKSFVQELIKKYPGKRVLVVGHRATQYGLERWVNGKSLPEITSSRWQWQPGWTYKLTQIREHYV